MEPIHEKLLCYDCNLFMSKQDYEELNIEWYEKISKNDALRIQELELFPSLIAHEYQRIFDLLDKGQTYGAFLQLKDMLEVMIKFPTCLALAEIFKDNPNNDYNQLLIEKPLALGDWETIAQKLSKEPNLKPDLKNVLAHIVKQFRDEKNLIVYWRNEKIGHGALAFDSDSEFIEDFQNKLTMIKDHYETYQSYYCKLHLFFEHNGKQMSLKGTGIFEGLPDEYIPVKSDALNLFPFMLIDAKGIYLFDAYYSRKQYSAILNYPNGKKNKYQNEVNHWFSRVYHQMNSHEESFDEIATLYDETYSALEAKILDQMQEVEDFVKPTYAFKWLNKAITEKDRGVFLMQLERGMGKTVFARSLDEHSLNEWKNDEFSVRAYYINDSFRHSPKNFMLHVNRILRQNKQEEFVIEGIHYMSDEVENPKQAFASMLNTLKKEHERYFHKQKLLFVIDGLDELIISAESSIFDFIPEPESLDEGVYVLLTSRSDKELSPLNLAYLQQLTLTKNESWEKTSSDYREILQRYIKKHIFKKPDQKLSAIELDKLNENIQLSEGRFLYIKALKELLSDNLDNLNEMALDEKLFDLYLSKLQYLYGDKYFQNISRLLYVLAICREPVTLQELTILIGEDKPTFKLLAYLMDLRGFIKVERSYRGNLFSISHTEWRNEIKSRNQKEIALLIKDWLMILETTTVEQIDFHHDADDAFMYLCCHIGEDAKLYSTEEDVKRSQGENVLQLMIELLRISNTFNPLEHVLNRMIALCEVLIPQIESPEIQYYYITKLIETNQLDEAFLKCQSILEGQVQLEDNEAYHFYQARSYLYSLKGESEKAFADNEITIQKVKGVIESLKDMEAIEPLQSMLTMLYSNSIEYYFENKNYAKAKELLDERLSFYQNNNNANVNDYIYLLEKQMRHAFFTNSEHVNEALETLKEAILQIDENHYNYENILLSIHHMEAELSRKKDPHSELEAYDQALQYIHFQQSIGMSQTSLTIHKARTLFAKCLHLSRQKKTTTDIFDLINEAIESTEPLKNQFVFALNLMELYAMKLGSFTSQGRYEDANEAFQNLMETKLHLQHQLSNVSDNSYNDYLGRCRNIWRNLYKNATSFSERGNQKEAIQYYRMFLEFIDDLHGEVGKKDAEKGCNAYINLFTLLNLIGETEESYHVIERALLFCDYVEENEETMEKLADIYLASGLKACDEENVDMALERLQKALKCYMNTSKTQKPIAAYYISCFNIHLYLGMCYIELDDETSAMDHCIAATYLFDQLVSRKHEILQEHFAIYEENNRLLLEFLSEE